MTSKKKSPVPIIIVCALVIIVLVIAGFATSADSVQGTFWALVPPIIAIALALVTKEVYSSLFVGVVSGALLYTGFSPLGTMHEVFEGAVLGSLTDAGNMCLLIWPVFLGSIVMLLNRSNAAAAFGSYAKKHIKSRAGAQFCSIILGIFIFIDDYFNCLTVGSVMRPISDKHNISRAKLAYIIDATAAPICIIAPISSWAAAVAGFVPGEDGLGLFIKAIPFNFYALLTIIFMLLLVRIGVDYGPMATHENNALKGDLFTTPDRPYGDISKDDEAAETTGKVRDLVIPIIVTIITCACGMLYTGGFFEGESFIDAFANCDGSLGLLFGSFFGLLFSIIYFICRRRLSFSECMQCIPDGFKLVVPAMLILILAWSLNSMTGNLGAAGYVAGLVEGSAAGLLGALPAVIFLIACGLSFATGTSWGTFGILIPIVVSAFQTIDPKLMIIGISACLAGSVCGDHCSPISDTTIMASAGAQCNHLNHVTTQLPYAITVAAISCISFVIAGYSKIWWLSMLVGIILTVAVLMFFKKRSKKAVA